MPFSFWIGLGLAPFLVFLLSNILGLDVIAHEELFTFIGGMSSSILASLFTMWMAPVFKLRVGMVAAILAPLGLLIVRLNSGGIMHNESHWNLNPFLGFVTGSFVILFFYLYILRRDRNVHKNDVR